MQGISDVFLKAAPEEEVRYEYLEAKHYRPKVVKQAHIRIYLVTVAAHRLFPIKDCFPVLSGSHKGIDKK